MNSIEKCFSFDCCCVANEVKINVLEFGSPLIHNSMCNYIMKVARRRRWTETVASAATPFTTDHFSCNYFHPSARRFHWDYSNFGRYRRHPRHWAADKQTIHLLTQNSYRHEMVPRKCVRGLAHRWDRLCGVISRRFLSFYRAGNTHFSHSIPAAPATTRH